MNIIKLESTNSLNLLLESAERSKQQDGSALLLLEDLIRAEPKDKVVVIESGKLTEGDIKPLQGLWDSIKPYPNLLKREYFGMFLRRSDEWFDFIESDDSGIHITLSDYTNEQSPTEKVVNLLDMPAYFQKTFKIGLELITANNQLVVMKDIEGLGIIDIEDFFQYLVCVIKTCNASILISSSDASCIKQINQGILDQQAQPD